MPNKSWASLREFILERDDYLCQDCEKYFLPFALHIHHVKEQWAGGTDDEDNLITLCPKCHLKRHEKTMSRWSHLLNRTKTRRHKAH